MDSAAGGIFLSHTQMDRLEKGMGWWFFFFSRPMDMCSRLAPVHAHACPRPLSAISYMGYMPKSLHALRPGPKVSGGQ